MKRVFALILCIVALITFWNTLSNGYNLDDQLVTKNHPQTNPQSESNLTTIFSSAYQNEGGIKHGFRPVTIASFYIEHQLFGESAKVSHGINLMLYLGIILLLYQLLTLLFKDANQHVLVFIALLFCVHSIHSETVASIKNRDELLCLIFFIISTISSIKWLSQKKLVYLASTIAFVSLSILSKKSALPIIALFPILLLFTNRIKPSQFVIIGLAFSIPISLFAFNLQIISGLGIFGVLNLCYLVVLNLPTYWEKKSFYKPTNFEFIILCSVLSLSIIGAFFQQLYLVIGAQLLLLFLVKKHIKVALFLTAIISLASYFVFFKVELLVYMIMLVSASILVQKESLKFNSKNLLILIPLLLLVSYSKGDYSKSLIYLSPLLIFATVLVHRFMPLIIGLLSVVVSLYFNVLGYIQLGIVLYAVLVLSKIEVWKMKKIFVAGWLCITYLFIGAAYENEENRFYFNTNVAENSISVDQQKLKQGRKLEFVENALVAKHSLKERFATGLLTMGTYLELMVYPRELSFYYGYSKINTTDFRDYKVWLSLSSYLLLLFFIVFFYNKQPLIAIGSAWFIVCIFLFSNFPVLVAGMVGERLAFAASVGFCILIGGILNWIKPSFNFKKPRGIEFFSLILLVVLAGRTIARNALWESETTLMKSDIDHLENSAQANYLLGIHSIKNTLKKGEPIDKQEVNFAITHLKKAIEIYPEYYNFYVDLGKAYLVLDELEYAKTSFVKAYMLEPDAVYGLTDLIKVSFELKRYDEVVKYGKILLEKENKNLLVLKLVAFSTHFNGDYISSNRYTKEALKMTPENQDLVRLKNENELLIGVIN